MILYQFLRNLILIGLIQIGLCQMDSFYKQLEREEDTLVYLCNFDANDNCGGVIITNNTGETVFTTSNHSQSMSSTIITDITSITKATGSASGGPFNGPPCKIPWYQSTSENYFCSSSFTCRPNQPESNATAYCQRGRFLWGRVRTNGEPYFGQLQLPPIDLEEPGTYEITFWAAMSCGPGPGCSVTRDTITVVVNDNTNNTFEFFIHIFSIQYVKVWIPYSFLYTTDESILDVKIQFQRYRKQPEITYYALDEIKIYRTTPTTGDETTTTTTTTTTSTSTRTTTVTTTTTTETTTTTTSTTTSNDKLVYHCDFDNNDNCGGTLFSNNTGILHSLNASTQSQVMIATTITDMTSITQPTGLNATGPFDSPPCIIPWYFLGNVNYFCSAAFTCMPYQPQNNATSNCQRGRFLWGRVNTVGNPYFGQLALPEIDLGQPGTYDITFWAAFSCEGPGCSLSGDSIKIVLNEDTNNSVVFTIDMNNIGYMRRWQPFSILYTTDESSILDIKIRFQRLFKQNDTASFAIDEINIYKSLPTSPTTPTTTTTSLVPTTETTTTTILSTTIETTTKTTYSTTQTTIRTTTTFPVTSSTTSTTTTSTKPTTTIATTTSVPTTTFITTTTTTSRITRTLPTRTSIETTTNIQTTVTTVEEILKPDKGGLSDVEIVLISVASSLLITGLAFGVTLFFYKMFTKNKVLPSTSDNIQMS